MSRGQQRSGRAPGWKYAGTVGGRRAVKADTAMPLAVPAPSRRPPARPQSVRPKPLPKPPRASRRPTSPAGEVRSTMPVQTALTWTGLAIVVGLTLSLLARQPWVLGATAVAVTLLYLWRQLR